MDDVLAKLNQIEKWALLSAKNMLTIDEAAIYIGLSKSRIYKMTSMREIAHSKPNGKQIYFDKADLDEWMSKNRVMAQFEADTAAASYCVNQVMAEGA